MVRPTPRHSVDFSRRELAAAWRTVRRGEALEGAEQASFSRRFASFIGVRHALPVASGRLGLFLILKARGYAPGSEILLSAYNFYVVAGIVRECGLIPVFVDIETRTFNIDPAKAESSITPRTRAILVTHMFGHPCDVEALQDTAARHGMDIIEDCAHSCGATYKEKRTGALSRAALFSFSLLKVPTTLGGGMITTDDDALYQAMQRRTAALGYDRRRLLRAMIKGTACWAVSHPWLFPFLGFLPFLAIKTFAPGLEVRFLGGVPRGRYPFCLQNQVQFTNLQSALGIAQLERIEEMIARKRAIAALYDEALAGLPGVSIPREAVDVRGSRLYYSLLVDDAGRLSRRLCRRGIDAALSEFTDCSRWAQDAAPCPHARHVEEHILRLPNSSSLSLKEAERIARAVRCCV